MKQPINFNYFSITHQTYWQNFEFKDVQKCILSKDYQSKYCLVDDGLHRPVSKIIDTESYYENKK
ncbi:Uncharacterised protein [Porphyromonas macacae]|uniref:Uncharacterized protein n=1 Tax=Porphyromonas macacae TaxID=28115 RepID=A0A379E8A0_9PORP|nr:Uncharacterised protein [Porphyromonas macacae]